MGAARTQCPRLNAGAARRNTEYMTPTEEVQPPLLLPYPIGNRARFYQPREGREDEMGTRADFYIGVDDKDAEWLGSIAFDGYAMNGDAINNSIEPIITAKSESEYRDAVKGRLCEADGTLPEHGWPWPWEDSKTTDYAYRFDGKITLVSCFGSPWLAWPKYASLKEDEEPKGEKPQFQNMKDRQRVTLGARSGVIVVTGATNAPTN